MEGLDLSNPAVIGSVIGAAILGAVLSSLVQMYGAEKDPEEPMNFKAVFRDALLSGISTGMGWVLLPDAMKNVVATITGVATTAATSVAPALTGGGSSSSSSGPELQIGPARF
jgi:hypothetical protein